MAPQIIFRLAYYAIEAFVTVRHAADYGAWQDIVPSGREWQYSPEGWEAAAAIIVANFNDRLPAGRRVSVPNAARIGARDARLGAFQRYLAEEAGAFDSAATLGRLA